MHLVLITARRHDMLGLTNPMLSFVRRCFADVKPRTFDAGQATILGNLVGAGAG